MSTGFEQTKEELQRTVREVFRVVLYRRWSFLVPFCVAASAVLISSHRLPREYKAHTIFDRRSPIPISKVLERSGPVSMNALRASIRDDMMGPEAMAKVAAQLGLTQNLPRKPDGRLTRAGRDRQKSIAKGLAGMLSLTMLKTGHDLDRIQLSARGSDPEMVVNLANYARDNYVEVSRTKFLDTLRHAQQFYQTEFDGLMDSIDLHERELGVLLKKYPYVNQDASRAASQHAAANETNKKNVQRRVEESRRKISRLEAQLASMPEPKLLPQQGSGSRAEFLNSGADLERERRRLMDLILRTEDQMMQGRIEKGMLERHPKMQTLIRKKERATHDLAALEQRIGDRPRPQEVYSADPAVVAIQSSDRRQVMADLAEARTALAVAEEQITETESHLSRYEQLQADSAEQRTLYRQMQMSLRDERNQLAEVRGSERRLSRVLEIDAKDEGIEFITIDEAVSSRRPISPKAQSILMLAFGVGLAFGACAVFLREFFDHTFHAASAVSFSLGVPVLEGIDEILLSADRRRLLARKLVMVPVACVFLSVLAVSGGLAYLSLEHPQRFKRIVEKATVTWDQVNVFG
ncbi:MAG: hypothetical protein IID41_03230 [Planctomycetes bacterium]|nr:hypothetical protein [Planctomycetota bacterium]